MFFRKGRINDINAKLIIINNYYSIQKRKVIKNSVNVKRIYFINVPVQIEILYLKLLIVRN